jgi:phosphoenolpyruvate carboxykinase (GTP)
MMKKLYRNSYKGKTMYVIPYSMGVIGSEFSKYGIELTDSIYVVLNMLIMTRVGTKVLEAIGPNGDFIKGLHAKADMDENNRYIVHFPEDNTIWSVNSGYGGNVLLGKKCFALRIASYLGRETKVGWPEYAYPWSENPQAKLSHRCSIPVACGMTNLANAFPGRKYYTKLG